MPKTDWGSGAGGAASGAATGAAVGSAVPGIGTAIGAGVGGVVGGAAGLFGGGKKKKKKRKTMSKENQQLFNEYRQAAQYGEGPMADLFGPTDMNGYRDFFDRNFATPALRQFQEDVIPQITGQFRGQNLGQSSYAGEALGRAGRDVQMNLDDRFSDMLFKAQQAGLDRRRDAVENIYNTQEFAYERPQQSGMGGFMEGIGQAAGKVAGNYVGDWATGGGNNGTQDRGPLLNEAQRTRG